MLIFIYFYRSVIKRGVCKFNVNTDLRSAAIKSFKSHFEPVPDLSARNEKVDVLDIMKDSYISMKAVAREKVELFFNKK